MTKKTHYIALTQESKFADLGEHETYDSADEFADTNIKEPCIWLFNKNELINDDLLKSIFNSTPTNNLNGAAHEPS